MLLPYHAIAIFFFLIFCIHTTMLSLYFFFSHSLTRSSLFFSRAFYRVFFPSYVFFPSWHNLWSFIYFSLKLFSSNRSCAVCISVKCHPCEIGCVTASFSRRLRSLQYHMIVAHGLLDTDEKSRIRNKKNLKKYRVAGRKKLWRMNLCYLKILRTCNIINRL